MKDENYHLALKWYTQGIIDANGDTGDGISGDFYDQYGDQFPDESETREDGEWISVEDRKFTLNEVLDFADHFSSGVLSGKWSDPFKGNIEIAKDFFSPPKK